MSCLYGNFGKRKDELSFWYKVVLNLEIQDTRRAFSRYCHGELFSQTDCEYHVTLPVYLYQCDGSDMWVGKSLQVIAGEEEHIEVIQRTRHLTSDVDVWLR